MNRMKKGGFTLMELMVTTAVMTGIAGVFMATLRMNQQSWEVAQSHFSVSSELRRGMDEMAREMVSSQAAQINIAADGAWNDTITFSVPEDIDGDGTILDSNGSLEWSDPITYSLDSDQVLREQDNADNRILANGVTDVQFRREAATPNIVEIQMTVRKATNTGDFPNTGTISTRVRLRN